MYFIAICDDEDNYIKYIKKMLLKSGLESEETVFYEYNSGEDFINSLEGCVCQQQNLLKQRLFVIYLKNIQMKG